MSLSFSSYSISFEELTALRIDAEVATEVVSSSKLDYRIDLERLWVFPPPLPVMAFSLVVQFLSLSWRFTGCGA